MYYFAYSSNMSLDHMRKICGWHCHFLGRASLPGFGLAIDRRGYLNSQEDQNSELYGILYSIDEEGLGMLDEFEAYPEVFGRKEVTVYDEHKIKYKAQMFIQPTDHNGGSVLKEDFLRRVLAAAYENHLPEEYIKKIEKLGKKA